MGERAGLLCLFLVLLNRPNEPPSTKPMLGILGDPAGVDVKSEDILVNTHRSDLNARSSSCGRLKYRPRLLLPSRPAQFLLLELDATALAVALSITCFLTSAGSLRVNRSTSWPGWTRECPVEWDRENLLVLEDLGSHLQLRSGEFSTPVGSCSPCSRLASPYRSSSTTTC